MVKQVLLVAGVAAGLSAFAAGGPQVPEKISAPERVADFRVSNIPVREAKMNDGSSSIGPKKAQVARPQWKRPAGQFWGTGFSIEEQALGYYFTPLVLRPFVQYDFQNISTVGAGNPSWDVMYYDEATQSYAKKVVEDTDLKQAYVWGEGPYAPILSYPSFQGYPAQYDGVALTDLGNLPIVVGKDIAQIWEVGSQPVSSHYWSMFTRNPNSDGIGVVAFSGATPYEGSDKGWWFGTNASGVNAAATRFEKPDQPYLLNSVYWYYMFSGDIVEEIPLKAYVFKTADDAKEMTYESTTTGEMVTVEALELGELIAVSESVIPLREYGNGYDAEGVVQFNFVERNEVTGAENAVSLEIDDDITIVVVGFDAPTSNGTFITSCISDDDYDEGYGNLGFLGSFNITEDGIIEYNLKALKNFFASEMPNTVLGVLADVSYPWLLPEMDTDVHLPNEGETTNTQLGLQYPFYFASTSMTDDFEVTYNGEEECDWLEIIDVDDIMYTNEDGEEEFAGECGLLFEAAPNPEDIDRTCVVKITIPAATCEITFRQGTNNTAVEVVKVDGNAEYYDLQGRKVANPEKGLYIKKSGNKAQKVIF